MTLKSHKNKNQNRKYHNPIHRT